MMVSISLDKKENEWKFICLFAPKIRRKRFATNPTERWNEKVRDVLGPLVSSSLQSPRLDLPTCTPIRSPI